MNDDNQIKGPTVRLVANAHQGREEAKAQALGPPAVRLVASPVCERGAANSVEHHVGAAGLGYPSVRLAHVDGAQGDCVLKGQKGVARLPSAEAPGLLVSYVYVEPFLKNQHRYCYRDWVLDSGAFSAHQSGTTIELSRYTDFAAKLLQTDPTLVEVFALDVIPSDKTEAAAARAAEQSLKNCEEMWRQGVPAIPTYHIGEEEGHLYHMAKHYPKVALGGVALLRGDLKFAWVEQCFARVWPKKLHGFGMAGEDMVYGLPFHSVDATNWEMAPCAFGNWQKFGNMSVRGSNQDLRSQVKHYLDLEAKARVRWRKEMELLESLAPTPRTAPAPDVRLSVRSKADSEADTRVQTSLLSDPKPKAKPAAPAPAPSPGKLDDKWVDYWKNRF